MRSIIFALFLAICCMVVYTNAAALPENSAENSAAPFDGASGESQFDETIEEEEDLSAFANEGDEGIVAVNPQSRTLFLLLPLLFPDQFYFS